LTFSLTYATIAAMSLYHNPDPTLHKYSMLDLFCGAGGTTVGYAYHFNTVGLDHRPQWRFPFHSAFIKADAIEFLSDPANIEHYDCFAASPPCGAYSQAMADRQGWPDLIGPVRELLHATGKPYIIENVIGAPLLRKPTAQYPNNRTVELCGSMFGLDVERHRLFESNIPLHVPFCMHEWQLPRFTVNKKVTRVIPVYGSGGGKQGHDWSRAMEIDWMLKAEIVNAIPPAYTKFLGAQMRAYMEHRDFTVETMH
jgi:DNA (cytosine-5)-methyltransferase 1